MGSWAQHHCLDGGERGKKDLFLQGLKKNPQTTKPDPKEQNQPQQVPHSQKSLLKPHEYLACPHVKYMILCKDQAKEVHDFFLIYGPSNGLFIAEQLCGKIHPLQNVIVHQAV